MQAIDFNYNLPVIDYSELSNEPKKTFLLCSVNRESLIASLAKVKKVVSKKSQYLPILSCVKLYSPCSNELCILGTNLDTSIDQSVFSHIKIKGEFCVNLDSFLKIIKGLSCDEINIEQKQDKIIINGKFTIQTVSTEDYPILPEYEQKNQIACNIESLAKCYPTVSNDDTRHYLNGIYINNYCVVSTDGHRLNAVGNTDYHDDNDNGFIVNKETIKILLSFSKTVKNQKVYEYKNIFYTSGKTAFFPIENGVVTSRLIDGDFPSYDQLIPNNENFSRIDKKSFEKTIKETMLFSTMNEVTKLDFSEFGKVTISKQDVKNGLFYKETIECKSSLPEDFVYGINGRYLKDALDQFDSEEITVSFNDTLGPCAIRNNDFVSVIMPMRL